MSSLTLKSLPVDALSDMETWYSDRSGSWTAEEETAAWAAALERHPELSKEVLWMAAQGLSTEYGRRSERKSITEKPDGQLSFEGYCPTRVFRLGSGVRIFERDMTPNDYMARIEVVDTNFERVRNARNSEVAYCQRQAQVLIGQGPDVRAGDLWGEE